MRARRPEQKVTSHVAGGRAPLPPARAAVGNLGWGSRAAEQKGAGEQEPASRQWGERAWCREERVSPVAREGSREAAPQASVPPGFLPLALAEVSADLAGEPRFPALYLASAKLLHPPGTAASASSCPAVSVVSDASTPVDPLSDAHAIGQGLLAAQRPIRSESRILKRSAENVRVRRRAALVFAGGGTIRRHLGVGWNFQLGERAYLEAHCRRRGRKDGTGSRGKGA
jgi:hypothetical protein